MGLLQLLFFMKPKDVYDCVNWLLILLMMFCTVSIIKFSSMYNSCKDSRDQIMEVNMEEPWIWNNFSQQQIESMSTLGQILYLNKELPKPRNKNYVILIHKHGKLLEARHIKNFGKKKINPFLGCSVQNCYLTYDSADIHAADAVIIYLSKTCRMADLPERRGLRPRGQRWIFMTDEAAPRTFWCGTRSIPKLDWNKIFNWSMSYRYDADIPISYGRVVLRRKPIDDLTHEANVDKILKSKKALAAILITSCSKTSLKWKYVEELSKHMPLAILGGCGKTTLCRSQTYYNVDCPVLEIFRFYLAFENSLCDQYITEKVWWNSFKKGAIPVVMGGDAAGKTYSQFLPLGSYLTVDDFSSPKKLADCLQGDCSTEESLRNFHAWRKYFEVKQEHAFFGSRSVHYCRVCEALNYNSEEPKTYDSIHDVIRTNDCRLNLKHPLY